MDNIATWSADERGGLFSETAKRLKLNPTIVEKDFWVCWTLKHVFSLPIASHLLFKGGTSLSKVFNAIRRFSEDVDLSIHRDYLGFGGDNDPLLQPSANKRDAQIALLQQACADRIRDEFLPQLRTSFEAVLGKEDVPTASDMTGGQQWSISVAAYDAQTVLFTYPSGVNASAPHLIATGYVAPVVKLEMGARSDPYPTGSHSVASYAAEAFPDLFEERECMVQVLEAERTFWEKATILHAEYHRPVGRTHERLSRHYYDLAQLALSDIGTRALADMSLLIRVAEHKKAFFRSGWAKYDEARPGSLRLIPSAAKLDVLRHDYDSMKLMIFGDIMPFDRIIETLQELENRINAT